MAPPAAGVVLVVAVCLLGVYFAVGTLVRYRKGLRHCPEVLPNFTFWRRLWYALRDGVCYIVTCGKHRPSQPQDAAVLPSKPRRDFGFEELPDDGDDFDDDAAMQPAVVVVRY